MADRRPVFFFDIDNCLYSKSRKVHEHMTELIDQYFVTHLDLTQEDAFKLHQEYYTTYGLAIEGLVRHHKIDPLEYNRLVDDALPLEDIIFRDDQLRQLLLDMDKKKVRMWLFTNAYVTHGKRVVRLLGVDDLFEGITYCDYGAPRLICKPSPDMFAKAMREAGVDDVKKCYFVDDSALNCAKAEELGWNVAYLKEEGAGGSLQSASKPCAIQIKSLEELRTLFPQFFVQKGITIE